MMNNKFNELLVQANLDHMKVHGASEMMGYMHPILLRYSELIVKECAEVVRKEIDYSALKMMPYNGWKLYDHFGIEP